MAKKIFKGFRQVTESNFEAENGFIYFVRNSANTGHTDGYLQFNGKKYGTAAEVAADLEAKIGTLPEGYDNLVAYIDAQVSAITGDYATNETVGTLSGRVDALEAVSADTRLGVLEAVSADTRLTDLENSAHTHDNKNVLDGISAEKVAAWDALSGMSDELVVVVSAYTGSDEGLTEGYLKTYKIFQGGDLVGTIDIPKDLVVSSGEIVEVEGTKYLRLTIANSNNPVDIAVSDLVDAYTPGEGIDIDTANTVSVKVVEANGLYLDNNGINVAAASADSAGTMSASDFEKLGSIEASAQTNVIEEVKVNGTALTIEDKSVNIELPDYDDTYAPLAVTGTVETLQDNLGTLSGRVDALEAISADTRITNLENSAHTHDNKAVLDDITAEQVAAWDGIAASGATQSEVGAVSGRVDALEAVSADTRLDALEAISGDTASALQSVSEGDASVSVGTKDGNNDQTVSVNISAASGNTLSLENDGLFAAIYYDGDDSN